MNRVLIVEPNAVNQAIVTAMVEELGYESQIAVSSDEATAALATHHHAVALISNQLPDAILACSSLRDAHGVFVVALGDAGAGASVDGTLRQPIASEALGALLARLLKAAPVLVPVGAVPGSSSAAATLEALTLFDRYVPGSVARMHALVAANNAADLAREAHKLRGGCAALGGKRMAALCSEIEVLAKAARIGEAAAVLTRLEAEREPERQRLSVGPG